MVYSTPSVVTTSTQIYAPTTATTTTAATTKESFEKDERFVSIAQSIAPLYKEKAEVEASINTKANTPWYKKIFKSTDTKPEKQRLASIIASIDIAKSSLKHVIRFEIYDSDPSHLNELVEKIRKIFKDHQINDINAEDIVLESAFLDYRLYLTKTENSILSGLALFKMLIHFLKDEEQYIKIVNCMEKAWEIKSSRYASPFDSRPSKYYPDSPFPKDNLELVKLLFKLRSILNLSFCPQGEVINLIYKVADALWSQAYFAILDPNKTVSAIERYKKDLFRILEILKDKPEVVERTLNNFDLIDFTNIYKIPSNRVLNFVELFAFIPRDHMLMFSQKWISNRSSQSDIRHYSIDEILPLLAGIFKNVKDKYNPMPLIEKLMSEDRSLGFNNFSHISQDQIISFIHSFVIEIPYDNHSQVADLYEILENVEIGPGYIFDMILADDPLVKQCKNGKECNDLLRVLLAYKKDVRPLIRELLNQLSSAERAAQYSTILDIIREVKEPQDVMAIITVAMPTLLKMVDQSQRVELIRDLFKAKPGDREALLKNVVVNPEREVPKDLYTMIFSYLDPEKELDDMLHLGDSFLASAAKELIPDKDKLKNAK